MSNKKHEIFETPQSRSAVPNTEKDVKPKETSLKLS